MGLHIIMKLGKRLHVFMVDDNDPDYLWFRRSQVSNLSVLISDGIQLYYSSCWADSVNCVTVWSTQWYLW